MLAVGLICGIAASLLLNVGIALQATEARSAPLAEGLRVSLWGHLLRRQRWIAGLLLGALGVPVEVVDFAGAPFVVIEPILACGLLVLLAIGTRLLGERPSAKVWGRGAPAHQEEHRGPVAVVVVVAALAAVSLIPFALRRSRFDTAMVANLGSACGFAATNVAAKLMADDFGASDYLQAASWVLVGGFARHHRDDQGMMAPQRAPATTVVPISTAVQTFLPVALEPLFLTESWRTVQLEGLLLLAGLVVLLLGTVLVSRARSVSTRAAGASAESPTP